MRRDGAIGCGIGDGGVERMEERTPSDEIEIHEPAIDTEGDGADTVGGIWGNWGAPPVKAEPSVDAVERFKDRLKRRVLERQGRSDDEE